MISEHILTDCLWLRAAEEEALKRGHEQEVLAHTMRTEEAVRSLEESHGHAAAVRTELVQASAEKDRCEFTTIYIPSPALDWSKFTSSP